MFKKYHIIHLTVHWWAEFTDCYNKAQMFSRRVKSHVYSFQFGFHLFSKAWHEMIRSLHGNTICVGKHKNPHLFMCYKTEHTCSRPRETENVPFQKVSSHFKAAWSHLSGFHAASGTLKSHRPPSLVFHADLL